MANYWIKFYHEILDDPKMAVLPDRLWRRVAELFLLAGRVDKAGELPDTKQIAWALRMPTDEVAMDLQQLIGTGIIVKTVDGWFIPNFEKRQGAATDAERKQNQRKKQHAGQYYDSHENVTNTSRNVTQIRSDTDTDTDQNRTNKQQQPAQPNIFKLYHDTFGNLATNTISAELRLLESEYPADWIADAFKETALNNAKSLKYTTEILRRWKAQGRNNGHKAGVMSGYSEYIPEGS